MKDPIDDDLAALLADAKTIAAPDDAKARVLARVAAALPPPAGGGGGGHAATSPPPPIAPGFPGWALAAALAVGAGLGLGGSLLLPPRERVVYRDRPVPAAPATVAQVTAQPAPSPPGLRLEDLPRAPTATPSTVRGDDLAKERAVLDVARSALGRGDAANALTATSEHERKFPQGALVEEREALAIQALALQGRRQDAQSRADRFRKRFPRSMLLPAVDAVVGAGPDSRERDL